MIRLRSGALAVAAAGLAGYLAGSYRSSDETTPPPAAMDARPRGARSDRPLPPPECRPSSACEKRNAELRGKLAKLAPSRGVHAPADAGPTARSPQATRGADHEGAEVTPSEYPDLMNDVLADCLPPSYELRENDCSASPCMSVISSSEGGQRSDELARNLTSCPTWRNAFGQTLAVLQVDVGDGGSLWVLGPPNFTPDQGPWRQRATQLLADQQDH